jgi:hypothetical protein
MLGLLRSFLFFLCDASLCFLPLLGSHDIDRALRCDFKRKDHGSNAENKRMSHVSGTESDISIFPENRLERQHPR